MFQTAQPRRLHGSWERRKPRPDYIHLTGSQEGSGDCSFLPPTGYLWIAQLQEATEHAGKLELHSEKPLPAAGKEASFKSVASHPHATMLVSTQPSHIPPPSK